MESLTHHGDLGFLMEQVVGGGGGGVGPWHLRQLASVLAFSVASGLGLHLRYFAAFVPRHRCRVPQCEDNDKNETDWSGFAFPTADSACFVFKSNVTGNAICQQSFDNSSVTACPNGYEFDYSFASSSLVTEFDLVCEDEWRLGLIELAFATGVAVGFFLGGYFSDRFGRRATLVPAVLVQAAVALLAGLARSPEEYASLGAIGGACMAMAWVSGHVLVLELFGPTSRMSAYAASIVSHCLSACLLALVVQLERDWRYMHLWVGLVALLTAVPAASVLRESVCWLLANDGAVEAEIMLISVAQGNDRSLSDSESHELRRVVRYVTDRSAVRAGPGRNRPGVCHLWRDGSRACFLILVAAWSASAISFEAISHLVQSPIEHPPAVLAMASLLDLPSAAFIAACVDSVGRKFCLALPLILLGITSTVIAFLPADMPGLVLAFLVVTKFASSSALYVACLCTAELFPTNLRSQAVGACATASRLALAASAMAAHFLADVHSTLPVVVLCLPAVVGGLVVAAALPETAGTGLQTHDCAETGLIKVDVVRAMADVRHGGSSSPGNSSPGVVSETDTEDAHSFISSSVRSNNSS